MANELQRQNQSVAALPPEPTVLERVLVIGDLSGLDGRERIEYYGALCKSLGLNPLSKPFDYIVLNDKLTLYAKRDCTDQLRSIRNVSIKITSRELLDGVFAVTAKATTPEGREDESIGAVPLVKEGGEWQSSQNGKRFFKSDGTLIPMKPDDRANAMMKAETKAKRRVTLSICGLGITDESELETIGSAKRIRIDPQTGDVVDAQTGEAVEVTKSLPPPAQQQPPQQPQATRPAVPAAQRDGHPSAAEPKAGGGGQSSATQPAAQSIGAEPINPYILDMWQRMGSKVSSICEVFAELKKDLEELVGSDAEYYAILSRQGMGHANDVKTVGLQKARNAAKELVEYMQRVQIANLPPAPPPAPGIDDSDIPMEMGGAFVSGPNPADRLKEEAKERLKKQGVEVAA